MGNKLRVNSLTGKMVVRLLNGLAVGVFLFVVFYFGNMNLLRQYLLSTGHYYDTVIERIEEFQRYVECRKLSATDTAALRNWAEERNIVGFTVSRERQLLFDVSYEGEISPGGKEVSPHTWKVYFPVTFEDGEADVYIYEGADEKYFRIIFGVSLLISFAAFLAIFISGMKEDVTYIQCLEKEVDMIGKGNLQEQVSIQGEDELTQLALGLERMRKKLKEKEEMEQELRAAQKKLVVGMSHDLRTPLTGLLTYMEVLKKQQREGNVSEEYLTKAYNRILQIKTLSDQMFEYFFIDSHKEIKLESPELISSALGDYLSEMCALLVDSGFQINADMIEWKNVFVQVNTDYVGRIMNNIISNIEKYGDKECEVMIKIIYRKYSVEISIGNGAAKTNEYVAGTGIGLKNITLMMEKMGGMAKAGIHEGMYWIGLYFPVYRED
ncbi:MAG: HAMP domain-containing sensor histidine kinase [Eubacteriales bacterium]|nr:HAMP domain-containing sensor histidine kinase [Eubacteriales bacterium]